jgi:hypothetical protein
MTLLRVILLACLFAACGPVRLAHAQADAPTDVKEPMIFVVAHGAPNACGPGCSDWIAAEGMFDKGVEPRFRAFLAGLSGRNLPIFFDSYGGIIGEARVIGRILRERRMTASVGETLPDTCRTNKAADPPCRKIMQESRDVKAKLRTATASCHSSCIYALIGASSRNVPPDVFVGLHGSRPSATSIALASRPGAPTQEQIYAARKRYVLEMGVEPGLVDLADKTPPSSLHRMTRDEIARYGIETRAPFETGWMSYEDRGPSKPIYMLKAVSQAKGADGREFRTAHLRLTCSSLSAGTLIEVQRELASNEIDVPATVRVVVGRNAVELQPADKAAAADRHRAVAEPQFVRAALAQGSITLVESFSPTNAPAWSRETPLSAKGLEPALQTHLKDCPLSAR